MRKEVKRRAQNYMVSNIPELKINKRYATETLFSPSLGTFWSLTDNRKQNVLWMYTEMGNSI
jgi:hypothetical protein